MLSRLPLRYKRHLLTVGVVVGAFTCGYGFLRLGSMVKRWSHRTPSLLHEEMDDYLYWKELQEKNRSQRAL